MNLTGKLNAGMNCLAKTMKDASDNCKLDGKIAEQQRKIKVLKKEISNLVLIRLAAGDEMCPEIMERYEAILAAKAEIEMLEKERKVSRIVCPVCGTKMPVNMNYCGKCGAKIVKEESSSEECAVECTDEAGAEIEAAVQTEAMETEEAAGEAVETVE